MMRTRAQRGNTLVVALIMLTLMTLIAVASLNISTTSVQVIGNMQFHEEAVTVAQQAIEDVITWTTYDTVKFIDVQPDARSISLTNGPDPDYEVTFTRSCVSHVPADGAAAELPDDCTVGSGVGGGGANASLCFWAIWDLAATATDTRTGASATVHQGVRVLTGLNAALAGC